jgi:hypothetical protein
MGAKAKRQARARERATSEKTLTERRANAPKGTSLDGGFAHGDGPAGPFGGADKRAA